MILMKNLTLMFHQSTVFKSALFTVIKIYADFILSRETYLKLLKL